MGGLADGNSDGMSESDVSEDSEDSEDQSHGGFEVEMDGDSGDDGMEGGEDDDEGY